MNRIGNVLNRQPIAPFINYCIQKYLGSESITCDMDDGWLVFCSDNGKT